jgi:hypothetical protein
MSLNIKTLISEECANYEFRKIDLNTRDNYRFVTIKEDCIPEIRQPVKEIVENLDTKKPLENQVEIPESHKLEIPAHKLEIPESHKLEIPESGIQRKSDTKKHHRKH